MMAPIGYTKEAQDNGVVIGNDAKWTLDISTFRLQHGSIPTTADCALENEVVGVDCVIRDARPIAPDLASRGFELVQTTTPLSNTSFVHDDLNFDTHYREVERVVQTLTGASVALAYCHATRGVEGGSTYGGYAHSDVAHKSWPVRMDELLHNADDSCWDTMGPPKISKQLALRAIKARRYAIVSAWRCLGPVQKCKHSHLAILDPATVHAQDATHFEIRTSLGTYGSNYRLKVDSGDDNNNNHKNHEWCYFPGMDRDNELLVFTVFDSEPGFTHHMPLPTVFHSAFQDPNGRTEPSRTSIDVRTLLIWDD
jgi:hypothetical protein